MDMAFMAKFHVQGRDAGRVLERVSANQVDGEPGRITYTQWLNPGGTLEADLTVTKLADDRFWVVASDTAHRHAETWLRRHIGDAHAFVTDVTSGYAQINIQGPRSRELLAAVTSADMSNEAFPFRAAARDRHRVRPGALHPDHLPRRARLRAVHPGRAGGARVRPAGRRPGARSACATPASRRSASLRMEKGYRDYGHDIDNTDTVLEAGLGFAVALDKPGGFIGRDAVLAQKARGPLTPAAGAGAGDRSRAAACSTPRSSAATAGRPATSAPRPTGSP